MMPLTTCTPTHKAHTSIAFSTRPPNELEGLAPPPIETGECLLAPFPSPSSPPPPLMAQFELPPSPPPPRIDHHAILITTSPSTSTRWTNHSNRSSTPSDSSLSSRSAPETASALIDAPYYYPPDEQSTYDRSPYRALTSGQYTRPMWQRVLITIDQLERTPILLLIVGLSLMGIGLFIVDMAWLSGRRK